jgi:three-Cys-motif partner protein
MATTAARECESWDWHMPPKKFPTIWKAEPHTIAKIEILKAYLVAWFQILGRSKRNQNLLYVDGFAGPGEYTNHAEGSPIAALLAAKTAVDRTGNQWIASAVHCAFIEPDHRRFEHLEQKINSVQSTATITIHLYNLSFVNGLAELRKDLPGPFKGDSPLFAFIDPFGATGVPFATVMELLKSPCSEVLINLDADGIARIFQAGQAADHEANLTVIFGDEEWKQTLSADDDFPTLCRKVLQLYKAKLKRLRNVRYCFSFEMRTSAYALNYHLVFASQHPLGLEKMKEAMKKIDQDGDYCFSDARANQPALFRFDDPASYCDSMSDHFRGKRAIYPDLRDYALNETPFLNPKSILKNLEDRNLIEVASRGPRRKGTFNEEKLLYVQFKQERKNG